MVKRSQGLNECEKNLFLNSQISYLLGNCESDIRNPSMLGLKLGIKLKRIVHLRCRNDFVSHL